VPLARACGHVSSKQKKQYQKIQSRMFTMVRYCWLFMTAVSMELTGVSVSMAWVHNHASFRSPRAFHSSIGTPVRLDHGVSQRWPGHSPARSAASSETESIAKDETPPDSIQSPVLQQLYPALLQHANQFGHPNIPLGTAEGRQCLALRRLRTQEKLEESDIALLDQLGFTWHSLEDVYQRQKDSFDEFVVRLKEYADSHDGDVSPPKKYVPDPELGAWVTALRRVRMASPENGVDAEHIKVLDELGFSWTSPRNCGSKFMMQYRAIRDRLKSGGEEEAVVFSDPSVRKWIQAQQQQHTQLSETRKTYMVQLLGRDWVTWKGPENNEGPSKRTP
jgi:Helicase associated domain